jgi:hypothetical protein
LYAVAYDHPNVDDPLSLAAVVWVPPDPADDELAKALHDYWRRRGWQETDIVIRHAARIHDVEGALAAMRRALIAEMGIRGDRILDHFLGYAIDLEEQIKMLAEAFAVADIELPDLGPFTQENGERNPEPEPSTKLTVGWE